MVSSQYIDGVRQYIAYRMRDTSEPDHAGNRETYGEYSPDRGAVEALARMLNEREAGT